MEWLCRKQLGFGCMRLPLLDPKDPTSFDHDQICQLFDAFLAGGGTYFDTAYTYHGYQGELEVRRALVERHPRHTFQLISKLPLRDFTDRADMERIFQEQMERCGVDFFDGYLLHNMGTNVYRRCCEHGGFDFVRQKKAEGRIGSIGMSFHDKPELLEEILERYGEGIDFLQLQINYSDWEEPSVQSRRCLELARRYEKPVVVMEPCKGGALINLPEDAAELLRREGNGSSLAAWALRFAASQEGVGVVLSGMNALEQIADNLSVFSPFRPLNQEEEALILKAGELVNANTAAACTGCGYCTHGCPKHIPIPQFLSLYNAALRNPATMSNQSVYYNNLSLATAKAGDCIGCGQCEAACPQHLPVIGYLKELSNLFDGRTFFAVRR